MTIEELYKYAVKHDIEDYDIKIYDDAYGQYYPQPECLTINNNMKEVRIG